MLFTKRHYRLLLLQTIFFNNSEMECFIQIIIVTYLANCNSHHIIIISYLHFPCCFIKTRCENAFSHPKCTASPKWVRQPFLKKYCKNYQSLTIILPDWWLWLQKTQTLCLRRLICTYLKIGLLWQEICVSCMYRSFVKPLFTAGR